MATVNSLAVDTGGLTIFNHNDVGPAIETIAADANVYCVPGYQPANYDGKYRRIDVRVKRPALSVRARSGYLAIDPAKLPPPRK